MENKLSDLDLMNIAIEEQNKCTLYPKVGAVIAKDGKVLSKAFRSEKSKEHAERTAIEKLNQSELKGATMITTLEPCVKIKDPQSKTSCTDLIIESGFSSVIIGVLDPNGQIYCQGFEQLLSNDIKVSFFTPELREKIESNTFKYGDCNKGYGPSGKRRVAIVGSGKNFEIEFSKSDSRSIKFKWNTLQFTHGIVDLIGDKDSIRDALGARSFDQITDPLVFRETSHYARMKTGNIAIISPVNETFIILIKLLEMTKNDIYFQWEVRKKTSIKNQISSS